MPQREALGGTLVIGGGFAGAYVAKLLGKHAATIVSPENFMLFTPILPEAASGTLEPRHVVVPIRQMCRHSELLLGRALAIDTTTRTATVQADDATFEIRYENLVLAVGAISRTLPIPGLAEHGLGFKGLADAIQLRNHVLQQLEHAVARADLNKPVAENLTYVFVGAGYAGVEALAELSDLVRDALRYYPPLRGLPTRWVLVDAAPKILPEIPRRLGEYAARLLSRRGVDIRVSTTLESVEAHAATLSDGERIPTNTLVWTAGVRASPRLAEWRLPLDERGRVIVDETLRVQGHDRIWALGDCARVPNLATPDAFDPPTSQHALRQARRLAKNLTGPPRPYRYRMLGQVATLGRHKGIADVFGFPFRGFLGWWITRTYHLYQLPTFTRKLRVVVDWTVGLFFKRDIAEASASSVIPHGSAMSDHLERAFAFMRRGDVRGSAEQPFRFGTVIFTPELPRRFDSNLLYVDRPVTSATELVAEADRLFDEAGLGHRAILFRDADAGDRVAAELSGWDRDEHVVMVQLRPPENVDTAGVAEVGHEGLRAARRTMYAEWGTQDVAEQLLDYKALLAGWVTVRGLAVLAGDEVVSYADLYVGGREAQIEDVATLPEHRRRGYAKAVVARAADEARAAGADFVFLVADAHDWPKELYGRLGFDVVGRYVKVVRRSAE